MVKKNIITLGAVLIFSTNLYAGSLSVKVEGQTVTAKVCNLPQGAKDFTFQISEKGFSKNGIAQPETRRENGCAIKVYPSQPTSLIQKGVEVTATYKRADGTLWNQTLAASGNAPSNPTPAPTPRPGTPQPPTPPPPVPQKETTPDAKVRNYAIEAANFIANRVVEAYGPVENFRFWFFEGFKNEARYNSDYRRLREYSMAFNDGLRDGREAGLNFGAREGNAAGERLGTQEAVGRFQKAVNNPAALDTSIGEIPTGEDFPGLRGDKFTPTMAEVLAQNNHLFLAEVRRAINLSNDFEEDIIENIFGEYWSLADYYAWEDYKYDMVFSRWRAENAFELFLNRKLVRAGGDPGKIQANTQMLELYRKITNPDAFSDAEQSRRGYYYEFVERYNDVIKSKWRKEVYGSKNYRAYERGVYYHQIAITEIARRAGYEAGYNPTFTEASREGYQSAIGSAYKVQFDSTVSFYTSRPVIESVRVVVRNQAGQTTVSVLDSLLPTFVEATNLGKLDGTVTATLSGNGLSQLPSGNQVLVQVPGLSRVATAQLIETPVQVSPSIKPNSTITVGVHVTAGQRSFSSSQSVTVSWAATVKQLANEAHATRGSMLTQYIVTHLAAEWKNETGFADLTNNYKAKPFETLAGQFVQAARSLSVLEQQNLSKHASLIMSVYGKRPTGLSKNKGKWDAATGLFKNLNYKPL